MVKSSYYILWQLTLYTLQKMQLNYYFRGTARSIFLTNTVPLLLLV